MRQSDFIAILVLLNFFCLWKPAHSEELSKAKDLYVTKCTKCHKLYDPADYGDEEWAGWTRKMKKKASLSDEQYELISRYTEQERKEK